jgi:transposase-like protein
MASKQALVRRWTVEQKARLLAEASKLDGEQLSAYLEQEGVKFAEFERWRTALEDDGRAPTATAKRIRKLERELARKEKALAEAAALLVLKKTVQSLDHDEDGDTDEASEK